MSCLLSTCKWMLILQFFHSLPVLIKPILFLIKGFKSNNTVCKWSRKIYICTSYKKYFEKLMPNRGETGFSNLWASTILFAIYVGSCNAMKILTVGMKCILLMFFSFGV